MRAILLLAAAVLAGCGGRVAEPVAMNTAIDDRLSCTHLAAEERSNQSRLNELVGEGDQKVLNNIGMLLVSPIFLDLSDTLKVESEALLARNQRLSELKLARGCRH